MDSNIGFSRKHPIITVVLIELSLLIVLTIGGAIATIKQLSVYAPVLISFVPAAVILVIYFTWRRKWASYGFTLTSWIYYVPLMVVLIVLFFQGFSYHPIETIAFYVIFAILVGFVEERIYRGLMVKILLPLGNITAILTSSLLFSFAHILNLLSGQSLSQTGLQLVYSLLIGIVLAQLFIKTGNIYPLILFHTIHNLIQFLGDGDSSAIWEITIISILCVTAFSFAFLFRKNREDSNSLIKQL